MLFFLGGEGFLHMMHNMHETHTNLIQRFQLHQLPRSKCSIKPYLLSFELYAFLIQASTHYYLAYINWPFIFSYVLFVNLSMCLTMNTMAWLIYNKYIWPFKSSIDIYLNFHLNKNILLHQHVSPFTHIHFSFYIHSLTSKIIIHIKRCPCDFI